MTISRKQSAAQPARQKPLPRSCSPRKKDVSFEELLESCIHRMRDRHDLPHTTTSRPSRPCRTAPGKAPGVASQFATRHSFTTPHEASFPVKTPRLGTPGHLSRMGELPSKAGITSDRSEWTRLPNSPGFYNSDKVLRSPPRTVFGRGAKHVDVSAWHSSSCENANYSKAKAQIGIADHQACAALCWAENPCKNYHSAFSSEQPRLVALPTGRSNDSKLATSLWGPSHHDHYSGAAVGPGSYEALEHNFVVPKYKAILHACCSNDLGLPQSLEQSKRVSIAALVHRYTGVSIKSDSDRVKQPLVAAVQRSATPGGALAWGVRSGADHRKRPVRQIMGRSV